MQAIEVVEYLPVAQVTGDADNGFTFGARLLQDFQTLNLLRRMVLAGGQIQAQALSVKD